MNGSKPPLPADPYLRALHLLARRDHTAAELRKKLALRGFPEKSVETAIERLTRDGLLDDRKFAERWVEAALSSGRGYGMRLLQDLQRRGIPRDTAALAVASASAERSEGEFLAALVARRFPAFDPATASPKEKQRVYGYLQRRGFSLGTVIGYFTNHDRGA